MKSKNSPAAYALACAVISAVAALPLAAQSAPSPKPAIALIDPADSAQWQIWTRDAGWRLIAPPPGPAGDIDVRVHALADAVKAAIAEGSVDPARVYLAGRGDTSAAVLYTISRVPDLWAAAVAIAGSPKPAFDTGRIFAANFALVPVIWLASDEVRAAAAPLVSAGARIEFRPPTETATSVFAWLATHTREPFPDTVDCETLSPDFARCYWVVPAQFDAGERNDVLPSTRIAGSNGATLDLGAFSFDPADAGPGLPITALPAKYTGPLKIGDRLLALDGKALANPRQYLDLMEKVSEPRQAVVTVLRGKERIRVETRILLPRRDGAVSSRVQARYLPADKEIQIVSRTVTRMRVTVPPHWIPATLLWNGLSLENLAGPGCWQLSVQQDLLRAEKCP